MNILFITAHKYLPQMYGGMQTSTDEFCHSLIARGHHVSVLAGLMPGGWLAFRSKIHMRFNALRHHQKISRDTCLGYPVWRSWFPWEHVEFVAQQEKSDVIVILAIDPVRMALAAQPTKIPLLMQLMDVEFDNHGGPFETLGNIACMANSRFTAQKYHEAYGINATVIYPSIAPEKYQTQSTRENVTFINPYPQKGLYVALGVAKLCPEIPFTFVESWPLSLEQQQDLTQQLQALPNITLIPAQKDMRAIYGKCKILLAPSIWEEAYGSVATEAQMSGIPVVASQRGGLPEAVGPGGILLDPDGPIEPWVTAVKTLWNDSSYYDELSTAATTYAQRPEMTYDYILDAMEKALAETAKKRPH